MNKRLLFIFIFFAHFCYTQVTKMDSLIERKEHYFSMNKTDSLIDVCLQIKKLSRFVAKKEHVNFYLANSYFQTDKLEESIQYSKKYLRTLNIKMWNRKTFEKSIHKTTLSLNLVEIYKQKKDYSNALKHLKKIEKKHHQFRCISNRDEWEITINQQIQECLLLLGKN